MENEKKLNELNERGGVEVQGHIKIFDPNTGQLIVNKRNAIHYENMSEALAQSLGHKGNGFIHEMQFGNGGTMVDPTGVITYKPAKNNGNAVTLYNKTHQKIVDDTNNSNTDSERNRIQINHTPGLIYTDIVVHCLLDYGEPQGQGAFDNASNFESNFVFDELGLKSYGTDGTDGKLLTHVVFHPVQKSLNRVIQIDYTVRIQTLTNLGNVS